MPAAKARRNPGSSTPRRSLCACLRAALVVACVAAAACAARGPERHDAPAKVDPPLVVTGTLAFRNGERPSPGSIAKVTVADFDAAEENAATIAASSIELDNSPIMIPFEVAVPKSALDSTKQYVLRGHIENAKGVATWATGIGQLIDASAQSDVDVGVLFLVPAQPGQKIK